jgi:hypothetical protein
LTEVQELARMALAVAAKSAVGRGFSIPMSSAGKIMHALAP